MNCCDFTVIGLYIPIHIDEIDLPKIKCTFNKFICDNGICLKDKSLVFNFQTWQFCQKYGMFREMEVIKWLLDINTKPVNFFTEVRKVNQNWILMYNYIVSCCGLAVFINGDNHPELEQYIKHGYRNLIKLYTDE